MKRLILSTMVALVFISLELKSEEIQHRDTNDTLSIVKNDKVVHNGFVYTVRDLEPLKKMDWVIVETEDLKVVYVDWD